MQETCIRSLGQEDPLEKEMATHSSVLAWRIPWTEEPGGLHTVHEVAKSRTEGSDLCPVWLYRIASIFLPLAALPPLWLSILAPTALPS